MNEFPTPLEDVYRKGNALVHSLSSFLTPEFFRFPLHDAKVLGALAILCIFGIFFIWTLVELILKKLFQ